MRKAWKIIPATDFREFVDVVLKADTHDNKFIRRMSVARPPDTASSITRKQCAQHSIVIAENLIHRRREIDAHYGWVLASDAELVYKSIGGKSEAGPAWARQWIKRVFDEHEKTRQALIDTKLELEEVVRRADNS